MMDDLTKYCWYMGLLLASPFVAMIISVSCSPPPPVEPPIKAEVVDRVTQPERDEILYDRDSGECWVIKRQNDMVSETLFHSDVVDNCYKFTIKGE